MTTSALRDLVTRHPGQADQEPFLEVVDLRVHFPTDDGLVKSVDGLSFALDRGRTLGEASTPHRIGAVHVLPFSALKGVDRLSPG